MEHPISIAIETSCGRGGVALGVGGSLRESVDFPPGARHAAELVPQMDGLLSRHGLGAGDLEEVYVSVGPGSLTGLRIGITAARTLAQAVPPLRCVAVPTIEAVAQNAAALPAGNLAVVMEGKEDLLYAAMVVGRGAGGILTAAPAKVSVEELLRTIPRPITLMGEALRYQGLAGEGIVWADESLWLPTARGVWQVGRRLAEAGQFVDYRLLRPLYLRQPEAVRLWEKLHPS